MRNVKRLAIVAALVALVLGIFAAKTAFRPRHGGKAHASASFTTAVGIKINLLRVRWLSEKELEVTYGASGLSHLKRGASLMLGDAVVRIAGTAVSASAQNVHLLRQGDKATIEAHICLSRKDISLLQWRLSTAEIGQQFIVRSPGKSLCATLGGLTPARCPSEVRIGSHRVVVHRLYYNAFLDSGDLIETPVGSRGKWNVEFRPGSSGRRSVGVLVYSDIPHSPNSRLVVRLKSDTGRYYACESVTEWSQIFPHKPYSAETLFVFKRENQTPRTVSVLLCYDAPDQQDAQWAWFSTAN